SPTPWFRYVPVNETWSVITDAAGNPAGVSSETLVSLRVADTQTATTVRWLPNEVYDKAFDAWEAARDSAYAAWNDLTAPNAVQPDLPLSFRDAHALLFRSGGYLGRDAQIELAKRLTSVPTAKVARAVRGALNAGRTDEERIILATAELDKAGITA